MASPLGERGSIFKSNVSVSILVQVHHGRIFRNSKSFHPRVSINVESQVDLAGKLFRSASVRMKSLKSPDRRVKMIVTEPGKDRMVRRVRFKKTAMPMMWIVRLSESRSTKGPITLLCVVVHESIHFTSEQGGNVPGRMKK